MANSLTARCLQFVLESPGPTRPCDIARHLKIPSNSVRMVLIRLADRGQIQAHKISPTRTDYEAPEETPWHLWCKAVHNWQRFR